MGALTGLTVVDLTQRLPGPLCTMLMADMGASVIQVESPAGDATRSFPPELNGMGAGYQFLGRNKQSVVLNLKHKDGRDACLRLMAEADVVIEGFRPGVAERLGIGYTEVSQRNPGVIYCSISGYGQDGPYRNLPGHDLNYLGLAGILSMTGVRDGEPVIPGVQIADIGAGGLMAALAVMAAVVHRQKTGEGQHVDVAMFDGLILWLSLHAMGVLAGGPEPVSGKGLLNGGHPCYAIYPTADGHLTVGCTEPHFWRNLCSALGREDLMADQWARGPRNLAVQAELTAIFRQRSLADWMNALSDADVCVAPVNSLAQALNDPQVSHRNMVQTAVAADGAEIPQLGHPFKLSRTPLTIKQPAPQFGQHTGKVLANLGFSRVELERMRGEGAIVGDL